MLELIKTVAIALPQPAHLVAPALIARVKIRALCYVDAEAFTAPCPPQLFQVQVSAEGHSDGPWIPSMVHAACCDFLFCSLSSRLLSLLSVCLGCGICVLHDPAVHLMQHALLISNTDRLASFTEHRIQQGRLLALVSDVLVADVCLQLQLRDLLPEVTEQ